MAIATGLRKQSANEKTADMVQIWILLADVNPSRSIETGDDIAVCGECPARGLNGKKRSCYVRIPNAPRAIQEAYQNGNYPVYSPAEHDALFSGRKIRFGAYGDPAFLPIELVSHLANLSEGWTGYTHQWHLLQTDPKFRGYFQASVDSEAQYYVARASGWSTFRVRVKDSPMEPGEFACPAAAEMGHRLNCATCLACDGNKMARGSDTPGPTRVACATIEAHGNGSANHTATY